jgi:hypothetical protein
VRCELNHSILKEYRGKNYPSITGIHFFWKLIQNLC